MSQLSCRFCQTPLTHDFVDLGTTPLANSYLTEAEITEGLDKSYPLHARVCSSCLLVQVDMPVSPENIFSDYAYFSSYSDSWINHAKCYAQQMIERFQIGSESLVVEIASNDGYLLKHFVDVSIPVIGIEPAANVALIAQRKGIPTEVSFFGSETARSLYKRGVHADLTVANNVLAHVPNIGDFILGFSIILKPEGVATFEFPHILNLISELQFDTIYHEHFSYLSLVAIEKVLQSAKLRAFDVEELPTHGGSLRLYVCHASAGHMESENIRNLRKKESDFGLYSLQCYEGFAEKVDKVKNAFQEFISMARSEGKSIAAYGAAAKGNTFLNVCGVSSADIVCVFDRSAAKQGKRLPGSHIPILGPDLLAEVKPDYLIVLPWNLEDEIVEQMQDIRNWGGKFVVAIPSLRIF